jgi:hypothetical protein
MANTASFDLMALAKAAGLSEGEIEGKLPDEILSMTNAAYKEYATVLKNVAVQSYILNVSKLPDFTSSFKKPLEVFAKIKSGAQPIVVRVVGYIFDTSEYIVFKGRKVYRISSDAIVDDIEEVT